MWLEIGYMTVSKGGEMEIIPFCVFVSFENIDLLQLPLSVRVFFISKSILFDSIKDSLIYA